LGILSPVPVKIEIEYSEITGAAKVQMTKPLPVNVLLQVVLSSILQLIGVSLPPAPSCAKCGHVAIDGGQAYGSKG